MAALMGQDLPLERPDADGRAALFVPTAAAKADVLEMIRKGAAIIGFGNHDATLTIYYESNRFNDPLLAKWEMKARKAYERLAENLPTVSKMVCKGEYFEQVGYISARQITIRRMEKLQRWLAAGDALDSGPDAEIITWAPPPPPKKIIAD
ncbi:MAG: hypothetical protein ACEQSK_11065 [Sphingomonadaceae bacterium]